jgi:hypothetical protein
LISAADAPAGAIDAYMGYGGSEDICGGRAALITRARALRASKE